MAELELTQASGLKPAVQALRRHGINADVYLERNGIPPNFIELPYAPVPKRRRLWAFLEDVEREEGLETLGFLMGDTIDLADVGPFGKMLSNAPTLLDAVRILHHNVSNIAQKNSITLKPAGDNAWFLCESYQKTCRPADHLTLMYLISIVRLAAGPDWCPPEAQLQTGPLDAVNELPLFKGCKLRFSCTAAGVLLPRTLLDHPILNRDPDGDAESIELVPIPDTGRLADSLRVIIATLLPYRGPPGAEDAAEMAGISRATLFRHLSEEGVTYKQLVEEVRFDSARTYLSRPDLNVKDVAFLLGYSAPNNFTRAFRNLAGVSPAEFRREALGS